MDVGTESVLHLRLVVSHYHVAVCAARIVAVRLLFRIQVYGDHLLALGVHVYHEGEFVIVQVTVQVVYLRCHFPTLASHHCILHVEGHIFQLQHHRNVSTPYIERILQRHGECLGIGSCFNSACRKYSEAE